MKNETEILIKKYYEGTASTEDLFLLRLLASKNELPYPLNDILMYTGEAKQQVSITDDFERKLFEIIENSHPVSSTKVWSGIYRFIFDGYRKYASVAAVVLIVFVSVFTYYLSNKTDKKGIVITESNLKENKKLAITELDKAFSEISENMGVAAKSLNNLKYLEKSEHKIYNLLNKLPSTKKRS